MHHRSRRFVVVAAIVAAVLLPVHGGRPHAAASSLPSRLADQEFWRLIQGSSEPDGSFRSDNLVSNERQFQYPVPSLERLRRGGAYLGVAPDQNFTFILALEPEVAFIVDIRRGNLLQHLVYKALLERSPDRAGLLSRLFSRVRPAGLAADASPAELFDAIRQAPSSEGLYQETLRAVHDQLVRVHGFPLTPDDLAGIDRICRAFRSFGPEITYSSTNGRRGGMPSFMELHTTGDAEERNHSYLASEEQFQRIRAYEERNLIVPIVGDFAGPKALRAIGRYLAAHQATVTAFYVSNVEQYLFQNGDEQQFYRNLAALPLDTGSTFIRSARGTEVLDPMEPFLVDVAAGRIRHYRDVTVRGTW